MRSAGGSIQARNLQDRRRGGFEFKEGSLHDGFGGFDGFGGSGEHLAHPFACPTKIQDNEATVAVLTVLAVSVMTATPP